MTSTTLVVHAHLYQPPRENPWTEVVSAEPGAAPFHDWNERITSECYRPNGWARIVDGSGRVMGIVNNYAHLSFNVGPTLLSWLEVYAPAVYRRILEGDRAGGGAIAQAYNHMILPLAHERDIRTQVRWGLADFAHRFGRPAEGLWLPETAVNDAVLAVLAEEGVGFTILAPGQVARVRPLEWNRGGPVADAETPWTTVAADSVDVRRTYRWLHPDGSGRGVDLVVYDGPLSHDVAFGAGTLSSEAIVDRVHQAGEATGGLVCIATDGETFGHHHKYAERALAYALPVEAPKRGVGVSTVARHLRAEPPAWEAEVHESAWSCAHGVGRWADDCGCSTGGRPGASQTWRRPLRDALDLLREVADEVFERRGKEVFDDPWAVRDAYIDVLLGRVAVDDFAARHVRGDRVEALTLLELQRHALLMYTSCGWFFWDLAGLETVQILRYAARALDLLAELGEASPLEGFLDRLEEARSNLPEEGCGRDVWANHVEPERVDARRTVAHLALADLLEHERPVGRVGGYEVIEFDHTLSDRGDLNLVSGWVTLEHHRTGRRSTYVFAALHLTGLEVYGAVRASDVPVDRTAGERLHRAFVEGESVSKTLRLIEQGFGPYEFGLEAALPDAAEQIVAGAAEALADRFSGAYERLFGDHRALLASITRVGYVLPPELRAPAELALARRFEAEVLAAAGSLSSRAYGAAVQVAEEARRGGFKLDSPAAAAAVESAILAATLGAVDDPTEESVAVAVNLVHLGRELGLDVRLDEAQEAVYAALAARAQPALRPLGAALHLAVDQLGVPGSR